MERTTIRALAAAGLICMAAVGVVAAAGTTSETPVTVTGSSCAVDSDGCGMPADCAKASQCNHCPCGKACACDSCDSCECGDACDGACGEACTCDPCECGDACAANEAATE